MTRGSCIIGRLVLLLTIVVGSVLLMSCRSFMSQKWWEASRESAGLSVKPEDEPRAVVQVYYARAFSWRGIFGVHSWVAWKEANGAAFQTAHVMGWRVRSGNEAVQVQADIPDRYWFGAEPTLLFEIIGPEAESAIPRIKQAIADYPYRGEYRVWPGPNSNTFAAFIIRQTPELRVELPPHAIGKDWLTNGWPVGWNQTGTGFQCSLFGVLGFTVGWAEGVEINILGASFGVDVWTPALKLPLVGRLGFADRGY